MNYAAGKILDEVLFEGPQRRELEENLYQLRSEIDRNRGRIHELDGVVKELDRRLDTVEKERRLEQESYQIAAQNLRGLIHANTSNVAFIENLPDKVRQVVLVERDRTKARQLCDELIQRAPLLQVRALDQYLSAQFELAVQIVSEMKALGIRVDEIEKRLANLESRLTEVEVGLTVTDETVEEIDFRVETLESGGPLLPQVHIKGPADTVLQKKFQNTLSSQLRDLCNVHVAGQYRGSGTAAAEVGYSLNCYQPAANLTTCEFQLIGQVGRSVVRARNSFSHRDLKALFRLMGTKLRDSIEESDLCLQFRSGDGD